MNKVHLVFNNCNGIHEFKGAFSTAEKAQQYVVDNENLSERSSVDAAEGKFWYISEVEVDVK